VTEEQTQSKTEEEAEEQRRCSSCDRSDTALFTLIIPPIITKKTELCRECLNTVLDNKRRKKSAQ
jgi:hypothetical protein